MEIASAKKEVTADVLVAIGTGSAAAAINSPSGQDYPCE